jgi:hypothetical protein
MRFNVEFPGYEHLDYNSREWLDYRLSLAELTSFHSLKLQSLKEFKLVMLISSATPESFMDALRRATQGLDVILFKAESASPGNLSSALLENVDAGCLAIQTSRIDSDDMFHPDYLRSIQDYCVKNNLFPDLANEARYFRYPSGQDYLTHRARYNRILYPENAFGTLIEPANDSVLTVFCDKHKRMSKRFVSHSLDDDRPMWCRIIHGSNLSNKPRKPLPLTGHFPVHPDLAEFARRPAVHPPQKHEPAPRPPRMNEERLRRRQERLRGRLPGRS